jgi:hypothetical protein
LLYDNPDDYGIPDYVPLLMIVWMVVFNNNANDASLNANNGTVTGATLTTVRFGKANLLA